MMIFVLSIFDLSFYTGFDGCAKKRMFLKLIVHVSVPYRCLFTFFMLNIYLYQAHNTVLLSYTMDRELPQTHALLTCEDRDHRIYGHMADTDMADRTFLGTQDK